jgi:hypothetical protein
VDCLDHKNVVACGNACSAEIECRYFYAADSGRCCLKAAYDSSAPMRKGVAGDFYELTTRGPIPPPPPPEPPPPLAIEGTTPADPVGNGLRCVSDAAAAVRVGQLSCSPAAATPASRRGTERVALVVVGQLKAAKEAVVMNSAHLLVSPLRRDFGDDGVDVYLCVDSPHAAEFAPPWKYGGLVPAAIFQVRTTVMPKLF